MENLYEFLPSVITYIVLGYVFIKIFRITRVIKNTNSIDDSIMESLVVGFIIKNCISLIPFSFGIYVDIIGMIISSAILGYVSAKALASNFVLNIIDKLKINHTKFKFMWQNIEDPDLAIFIDATNPDTNVRYFGQLLVYEEYERFPIIQIGKYMNWKDDELINDFSNDPTRTILIDTSKFTEIDITYQNESKAIKRWS